MSVLALFASGFLAVYLLCIGPTARLDAKGITPPWLYETLYWPLVSFAQSSFGQFLLDSAGDDEGQRGTGYRVVVTPSKGFEFGKVEVLVVFDFDFLGLHAEA